MVYIKRMCVSKKFYYYFVPLFLLLSYNLVLGSFRNVTIEKIIPNCKVDVNIIQNGVLSPNLYKNYLNFVQYDKTEKGELCFECEVEETEVVKKKQSEKKLFSEKNSVVKERRSYKINCNRMGKFIYSCSNSILLFVKVFRV